jgi:hypothetical protein
MLDILLCRLQMYDAWLISRKEWITTSFSQKKELRPETSDERLSSEYTRSSV